MEPPSSTNFWASKRNSPNRLEISMLCSEDTGAGQCLEATEFTQNISTITNKLNITPSLQKGMQSGNSLNTMHFTIFVADWK